MSVPFGGVAGSYLDEQVLTDSMGLSLPALGEDANGDIQPVDPVQKAVVTGKSDQV